MKSLVSYNFFFFHFKCEFALGYVTEHGKYNGNECVWNGSRNHVRIQIKKLDHYVVEQNESGRSHCIPEKLDPAMKVWLRENYVPWQNETYREADTKRDNVCSYTGCYFKIFIYMYILIMDNIF